MQPRPFASARLLTSSLLARGLAVSLVSAGLAAAPITANADATTFSGDAYVAKASVAAVNLTVASHTVSADFLMARAMAVCGPSVSGSSDLANLVVDGTPITVSGKPNQTISLNPIGSVIIDEQQSSVGANSGSIDVN